MHDAAQRFAIAEALRRGASVAVTLWGGSMRPLVPPGSTVTLEPLAPGDVPHVGELVAVETEDRLVVHRLVAWSERSVTLAADAGGSPQRFEHARVLGRARGLVFFGRRLPLPSRLARPAHGALLQSVPLLRRARAARSLLRPLSATTRRLAAPLLAPRLVAALEPLPASELRWLERAWLARGHHAAPHRERWARLAAEGGLQAVRRGRRLIALVETNEGRATVSHLDSRIASDALRERIELTLNGSR